MKCWLKLIATIAVLQVAALAGFAQAVPKKAAPAKLPTSPARAVTSDHVFKNDTLGRRQT